MMLIEIEPASDPYKEQNSDFQENIQLKIN